MTKRAEKQHRERMEAEAKEAKRTETFRAGYPLAFREALAAALKENMRLTRIDVQSGLYTLYDNDADEEYEIYDNADDAVESSLGLQRLDGEIKSKEMRRAEAQRINDLRQTAFAKLTLEERQALGL